MRRRWRALLASLAAAALLFSLTAGRRPPDDFSDVPAPGSLAVLAVALNESHIVAEWLAHYFAEGADLVVLLDNGSTDGTPETARMAAAKMNRSADLVVLPAEGRGMQPRHYDSARPLLASRGADLVLVVDLDEFMYSSTPLPLASELRRAFADPSVGQVSCKWRMFGSSGLPSQPASVRESFVRRAAREHAGDKSAARLPHLARFGVHRHLLRRGVPAGCPEGVRLNHYRAQSEEFWRVKMGRAPRGWKARDAARARREADRNEVEDAELREMVVGGRLRGSRIGIGGFGSGTAHHREVPRIRAPTPDRKVQPARLHSPGGLRTAPLRHPSPTPPPTAQTPPPRKDVRAPPRAARVAPAPPRAPGDAGGGVRAGGGGDAQVRRRRHRARHGAGQPRPAPVHPLRRHPPGHPRGLFAVRVLRLRGRALQGRAGGHRGRVQGLPVAAPGEEGRRGRLAGPQGHRRGLHRADDLLGQAAVGPQRRHAGGQRAVPGQDVRAAVGPGRRGGVRAGPGQPAVLRGAAARVRAPGHPEVRGGGEREGLCAVQRGAVDQGTGQGRVDGVAPGRRDALGRAGVGPGHARVQLHGAAVRLQRLQRGLGRPRLAQARQGRHQGLDRPRRHRAAARRRADRLRAGGGGGDQPAGRARVVRKHQHRVAGDAQLRVPPAVLCARRLRGRRAQRAGQVRRGEDPPAVAGDRLRDRRAEAEVPRRGGVRVRAARRKRGAVPVGRRGEGRHARLQPRGPVDLSGAAGGGRSAAWLGCGRRRQGGNRSRRAGERGWARKGGRAE